MKGIWKFLLIIFAVVSLSGCGGKTEAPTRVVTGVEITTCGGTRTLRRYYTQPQKIQKVLNYLRLQESEGFADTDPERLTGTAIVIDVTLSDGSHSVYYQRGGRYLSKKYHPWQKINTNRAMEFYETICLTPTDL